MCNLWAVCCLPIYRTTASLTCSCSGAAGRRFFYLAAHSLLCCTPSRNWIHERRPYFSFITSAAASVSSLDCSLTLWTLVTAGRRRSQDSDTQTVHNYGRGAGVHQGGWRAAGAGVSLRHHSALNLVGLLFPPSNTSTQEEMGWRRRLWRRAPSWRLCVTPSRSTPRAPTPSSRPLSLPSTPKVTERTLLRILRSGIDPRCWSWLCSFLSSPSAWWDGHQDHWEREDPTW